MTPIVVPLTLQIRRFLYSIFSMMCLSEQFQQQWHRFRAFDVVDAALTDPDIYVLYFASASLPPLAAAARRPNGLFVPPLVTRVFNFAAYLRDVLPPPHARDIGGVWGADAEAVEAARLRHLDATAVDGSVDSWGGEERRYRAFERGLVSLFSFLDEEEVGVGLRAMGVRLSHRDGDLSRVAVDDSRELSDEEARMRALDFYARALSVGAAEDALAHAFVEERGGGVFLKCSGFFLTRGAQSVSCMG